MKDRRQTYNMAWVTVILLAVEVLIAGLLTGAFLTLREIDTSISLHHPEYRPLIYTSPLISIAFLFVISWKNRAMKRLGDSDLHSSLIPMVSPESTIIKFILWRVAIALLFVALLGPKVGSKIEEVETRGIDLMIALDVSNSMLAEDLEPNRMEHSKRAIQRIINELQGNRMGIIIFAGDAYVQLPLTSDVQSARVFLKGINPGMVPTQGTSIGAAIDLCMESFDPESEAGRMILLITDGENHEDDAVAAAKRAADEGVKICAIGAGAPGGAPIPNLNSRGQRLGFKTDREGNTIVTALNESLLIDLVKAGNGVFIRSNPTGINLTALKDAMNDLEKGEIGAASFTDHEHLFHLFVIPALLILLLEMLIFERKWNLKFNIG